MESFLDAYGQALLEFVGVTALLLVFAWVVMDKGKGTPNPVWKLFGLTKKHAIGWIAYLCIAAVVSGVIAHDNIERLKSQPTFESPLPGKHYILDGWRDSSDPIIEQRLAAGDNYHAMSIRFTDASEAQLVYLGETYICRYTDDGSSLHIEVDAPAFPGGLSGMYYSQSHPSNDGRRMIVESGTLRLKLWSDAHTYYLINVPEIKSPPILEPEPPSVPAP